MNFMIAIGQPGLKTCVPHGVARLCALALFVVSGLLNGCSDATTEVNQANGIVMYPPEFLQARNINLENLVARVYLEDTENGRQYNAIQTNDGSTPWIGQAIDVPEGSVLSVNVVWEETGIEGLPDALQGILPLAFYSGPVDGGAISVNTIVVVDADKFITESSDAFPDLDLDGDGASNLQERLASTDPNDSDDTPAPAPADDPEVIVFYSDQRPVIDGQYDPLWTTYAQFQDQNSMDLGFDNVVLVPDTGLIDPSMADDFKWAAVHDGTYLYLLVIAESGNNQTPFGDSEEIYHDDSVDIYWDGNNSKNDSYDGVDDFHVIVGLLAENGEANNSNAEGARIEVIDNSTPIDDLTTIQYAVDLSNGIQQIYEFRLDLDALKIPIGSTFGFELDINNDADGEDRDAKWVWSNDSGVDNTSRFPSQMGNIILEALP